MHALDARVFTRGLVAAKQSIPVAASRVPAVGQMVAIGRHRLHMADASQALFMIPGLSPLRGVVVWHKSEADVIVRHASWSVSYMRAWLTGMTAFSVASGAEALGGSDPFAGSVSLVTAVVSALGYAAYRRRMSRERDEAERCVQAIAGHFAPFTPAPL
jgi:hypothetical protein